MSEDNSQNGESAEHNNPVDTSDVSDSGRARMLTDYIKWFEDTFGNRPLLMPLAEGTKEPAISGNASLFSGKGRSYLVTPDEAIRRIHEDGATGFTIYAGVEEHGTEDLCVVDVDDRDLFPHDEFPDTLEVLSGSGDGDHHHYRNDGSVDNAFAKGDYGGSGEVKAENWFVITPGSVHPSGGVYHITVERECATLSSDEMPEEFLPGTTASMDETDDLDISDSAGLSGGQGRYTNDLGMSLESIREKDDKLDDLLSSLEPAGYPYPSASEADYAAASKLHFWRFDRKTIARIIRDYRARPKVVDRDDYLRHTVAKASTGEQMEPKTRDEHDPEVNIDLPENSQTKQAISNLNYQDGSDSITKERLQERVSNLIDSTQKASGLGSLALIEAVMGGGKTYNTFRLAAEKNRNITYLTEREDLYDQAEGLADKFGLSSYELPSFTRHCPCYQGEHGEAVEDHVTALYGLGATPSEIHERLDLPCQEGGEECPYIARWNFEPDNFDVLIGHYKHAYLDNDITAGRHIVIDEFPEGALWTEFRSDEIIRHVNGFCTVNDGFPADDYNECIRAREEGGDLLKEIVDWFEKNPPEREPGAALSETHHTHASHLTFTLCTSTLDSPDYPFNRAITPGEERHKGVYFEGNEDFGAVVRLQTPPGLQYASSITCLDGTPVKSAWEHALDKKLTHRRALDDDEREEYLRRTMNVVGVAANASVKAYSSGRWVTTEKDGALFEGVAETYGIDPVVFTPRKAKLKYLDAGLANPDGGPVKKFDHFKNLKGTNKYGDEKLAIISGSSHYGDIEIKIRAAMEGEAVYPEGKGIDRDYGYANRHLRLMRESQVAQAALRIAREEGNGGLVVFNTSAIPDWFPIAGHGHVVKTWTKHQREVYKAMTDLFERGEEVYPTRVAEHEEVNCTRRHVCNIIETFTEYGYVDTYRDGRKLVVQDDGLHWMNEKGEVELPQVDLSELAEEAEDEHTAYIMPLFLVPPDQIVPPTATEKGDSDSRQERAAPDGGAGPPPD